jgi:hypothetical protein
VTADILIPLGAVIAVLAGAVALGVQKNRIDTAHDRINSLDHRVTALLAAMEAKIDIAIRLAERIDERTKRQRRDSGEL